MNGISATRDGATRASNAADSPVMERGFKYLPLGRPLRGGTSMQGAALDRTTTSNIKLWLDRCTVYAEAPCGPRRSAQQGRGGRWAYLMAYLYLSG